MGYREDVDKIPERKRGPDKYFRYRGREVGKEKNPA